MQMKLIIYAKKITQYLNIAENVDIIQNNKVVKFSL